MESTTKWQQPFPLEIPYYPVEATKDRTSSSNQPVDPSLCVRDAFVPSHLPPYPPTHTYRKTKILPGDSVKVESMKRSLKDSQQGHDSSIGVMASSDNEKRKILKSSKIQSVQNSLTLIEDSIDNIEPSLGNE